MWFWRQALLWPARARRVPAGAVRAGADRLVRDAVDGHERLRLVRGPRAALVQPAARGALGRGDGAVLELPAGARREGRFPRELRGREPDPPQRLEVPELAARVQRGAAADAADAAAAQPDAGAAPGPPGLGLRPAARRRGVLRGAPPRLSRRLARSAARSGRRPDAGRGTRTGSGPGVRRRRRALTPPLSQGERE